MSIMSKHMIKALADFDALEGERLFESEPVVVTEQRIQDFCRGTLNEEWIHWDRPRCQASHLGDIIAPGLFLPALFPGMFWQHMDIDLPRIIVKGIEGIRVYRPVLVDTQIYCRATLAQVMQRSEGIEVHYFIEFFEVGVEEVVAQVTFMNRYWDD
ncbi:MAG: MaoC family dehydratase [Pseudomonadales bacterium]|nr:MaoC family dehydratase [Pseudomonadales bacterium]